MGAYVCVCLIVVCLRLSTYLLTSDTGSPCYSLCTLPAELDTQNIKEELERK